MRLIVHGALASVNEIFHAFSPGGEPQESFGSAAPVEHAILGETLSWGRIDCEGFRLADLLSARGLFQLWTLDPPRLVYERALPSYRMVEWRIDEAGRAIFDWFGSEGRESGATVELVEEGVLLQVLTRDAQTSEARDYRSITTLLYSYAGEPREVVTGAPHLGALTSSRLYAVRQLPYPRISASRFRR